MYMYSYFPMMEFLFFQTNWNSPHKLLPWIIKTKHFSLHLRHQKFQISENFNLVLALQKYSISPKFMTITVLPALKVHFAITWTASYMFYP